MATYPITADGINVRNILTVSYKPDYTYWVGLNEQNYDVINTQTVKSSKMIKPLENDYKIINIGDVWDYTKQTDERCINSGIVQGIVCPAPYTGYKNTRGIYPCTIGYYTRLDFKTPILVPHYKNSTGVSEIIDNYWLITSIRVYQNYSNSWRAIAEGIYVNEGVEEQNSYFYIDVYNTPSVESHGYGGMLLDLGFALVPSSRVPVTPTHILDRLSLRNKANSTFNRYTNIKNEMLSMQYGALEVYPPNLFVTSKISEPNNESYDNLPYRVSPNGQFYGSSSIQIYKAGTQMTYSSNETARTFCWYVPFLSNAECNAAKACNHAWEENVLALYKNDPNRA